MICEGQVIGNLSVATTITGELSQQSEISGSLSSQAALSGSLSAQGSIEGSLSATESLNGTLTIPSAIGSLVYTGEYEATPKTDTSTQVFATAMKTMTRDFLVYTIPTTEEYNSAGGVTFTIGEHDGS